jgi:Icc protein
MRLVQISDTHLYASPSQTLLKLNTQQSFEAVVELLQADTKKPDIIILTGDMSQDNSAEAYERVVKAFGKFTCPIYWIPGNHDDPELLASVFSKSKFKDDKAIVLGNWLLVLLNSHYPKHVAGQLSRSELSLLDHYLTEHADKNALVFLHHPPVPFGAAWLDKSRLINPDDLFNITEKHSHVRGIICGHAHQDYQTHHRGLPIISAPSTCIQFLPHQQEFTLDTLGPGYRWMELQSDGKFKVGVERVKDFENTVDFSAKGY